MIPASEDIKRQMVPRWRTLKATAIAGELAASVQRAPQALDERVNERLNEEFNARIGEWREETDAAAAEELVATAILLNRTEDDDVRAAADLLTSQPETQPGSREVAASILGHPHNSFINPPADERAIRLELARRKRVLRVYPRDSLLLAETALLYTSLGLPHAAEKQLRRATAISPDDRYVLRSFSRFCVHSGNPDRARYFLARSSAVKTDPWLLSAHLAVEDIAERRPTFWREARRMLENASHSDHDLTELAAAAGTLDLEAGSFARARKMFRRSLKAPTENSLAQAQWAHRRDPAIETAGALRSDAFEALAWQRLEANLWNEAIQAAEQWQDLEPFSIRPAVTGSFICVAYLGDGDRAERFCRRALIANGASEVLRNNLAVALAMQGKVEAAVLEIQQAKSPRSIREKIVRSATLGLIEMRRGQIAKGASLYASSMKMAIACRDPILWCRSAANFTLESARYDKTNLSNAIRNIEGVYNGLDNKKKLQLTDVPALLLRAQGTRSASEFIKSTAEIDKLLAHVEVPAF